MTLHAQVDSVLADFSHVDPHQRELAQQYRRFLVENDDATSRSCQLGHITASALVVDAVASHVLLTLHPKVGRWLQLGGHLEPGDVSLRDGAVREVIEESGFSAGLISTQPVRLDRHPVPCGRGPDGEALPSEHLDTQFVVVVPERLPPVISAESDDLRWFPVGQLPDVDQSVRLLIRDALDQMGSARPVSAGSTHPWVTFG